MVALQHRQYFELACPACSSKNLHEAIPGRLRCCSCNRTDLPGDCAVASVQTEMIEETDSGLVVLAGAVNLEPGHAYEVATTPMRCPTCGALGVEVASATVGACFACYSAVAIEDLVIGCRDTEQSWVVVPLACPPRAGVGLRSVAEAADAA